MTLSYMLGSLWTRTTQRGLAAYLVAHMVHELVIGACGSHSDAVLLNLALVVDKRHVVQWAFAARRGFTAAVGALHVAPTVVLLQCAVKTV